MKCVLILFAILYLLTSIGLFKLFIKAGKKGWLSFIPIYNLVAISNVIGKPWWLVPLIFIPVLGHVILIFLYLDMINCYKKHTFFEMLIAAFFPFLWLPYLGFSKKRHFKLMQSKYFTLLLQSFVIYILLIAFVSTIRMLFLEVYSTSTTSMASTLQPGEYVFVNKSLFGPRLPITPLSVPSFILNPYLPDIYSDKVSLSYKRLWQIQPISRNDIIVFNYPLGDTVSLMYENVVSYYSLVREYGRNRIRSSERYFGKIEYRPIDKRNPFISRCVALPGDTLNIFEGNIFISGKQLQDPSTVQYQYFVISKVLNINVRIFETYEITEVQRLEEPGYYIMFMSDEKKCMLEKLAFIEEVTRFNKEEGDKNPEVFPVESTYNWNVDNMGPVHIPKKEVPIKLTVKNIPIYYRLIKTYEKNEIQIVDEQIIINGIVTDEYTPKMDYYWVMGDNRYNALDSRYWGFVPEDHIIGIANSISHNN